MVRLPFPVRSRPIGKGRDTHIVPINDLREHDEHLACWCAPRFEKVKGSSTALLVVHHALDGRELIEEHGVN